MIPLPVIIAGISGLIDAAQRAKELKDKFDQGNMTEKEFREEWSGMQGDVRAAVKEWVEAGQID